MSLTLSLKYRPGSFVEVIGQEQVTKPLMNALDLQQIHHAYLFSGPRGCGKTSSARILARSLNCEKGPTANPCGECRSCTDLIPNGPGSLDVIEMDAATHGLVDDARDLRDKALFAPVQSRYKVYIIDEAHQLGPAAANALLKIVEEPPPYVIFIFATTEPEKLIATIRSRTHHYQFRLVAPEILASHIESIAKKEGITLEEGVMQLVVRSGSGSVRDSLSALGQLFGGAVSSNVSYDMSLDLLGQTGNKFLTEIFQAMVIGDLPALIKVVSQVISRGTDPRRFLQDILDRVRDMTLLLAADSKALELLRTYSPQERENMAKEAGHFGIAQLLSFSEILAEHLVKLRGPVPAQILLEMMFVRMVNLGQTPAASAPVATPISKRSPDLIKKEEDEVIKKSPDYFEQPQVKKVSPLTSEKIVTMDLPSDLEGMQRNWPFVIEAVKKRRRLTWSLLSSSAHIVDYSGQKVIVSLSNAGALDSFMRSKSDEILRDSFKDVFSVELELEVLVGAKKSAEPIAEMGRVEEDESIDQLSGEALLMRELGAQVISKDEG
ncbi:MAG: DNA polymerase III subunit gamma/tau [Actinobacteria bacterium]|nr:DNA polymerase III subunit gamma/tau [Actinomycetota bacterium]